MFKVIFFNFFIFSSLRIYFGEQFTNEFFAELCWGLRFSVLVNGFSTSSWALQQT